MSPASKPFQGFLSTRRADLRRIAGRSRGEHTIDDVVGETWIIAHDIERKRGFRIDFADPGDQDVVLAWLHNRLIRFGEKNVRFAVKLDRDWDTEDADQVTNALAGLLAAPEHFDPLVQMELDEDVFDPLALSRRSYSQASAYLILLHRFRWDLDALADRLRLAAATVRNRVITSAAWLRVQPSLFDGIHATTLDFRPTVARGNSDSRAFQDGPRQLAWTFD
jgi:hypothetical protein